jgi:DNA-binding MarR family transcriptional regulator
MAADYNLISVEKRILLHLLKYNKPKYEYEIPYALTTNGIAENLGSSKSWATIPINQFVKSGKIHENIGHINHRNKRQKYYYLTNEGRKYAKKIRSALLKIEITLKGPEGTIKIMPLGRVTNFVKEQLINTNITEMDIFSSVMRDRIVDINRLTNIKKERFVDYSQKDY